MSQQPVTLSRTLTDEEIKAAPVGTTFSGAEFFTDVGNGHSRAPEGVLKNPDFLAAVFVSAYAKQIEEQGINSREIQSVATEALPDGSPGKSWVIYYPGVPEGAAITLNDAHVTRVV